MTNILHIPNPHRAMASPHMGIHQVIAHLYPYLSAHYAFVSEEHEADVIISHAGAYTSFSKGQSPSKPFIAVCHGLHPTGHYEMSRGAYLENQSVIQDLIVADKIVVPSHWVAEIIYRNFKLYPDVIQWGVDLDDWQGATPQGYVLWNKGRADLVCNPAHMQAVAKRLPQIPFVSTFGDPAPNVRITGPMTHEKMKELIRGASLYLATTKETGDIGSREALAAGIPVVAFAQGGVLDAVHHGVNGFLGNTYDELAQGILYCLRNRDILSQNAKALAQSYGWERAAKHMIHLIESFEPAPVDISVIIPCHNYAAYVSEAIQSVLAQECNLSFEVVVVEDSSQDNSWEVIQGFEGITSYQVQFKSVANARNFGIQQARGRYILCLDADDVLLPNALQVLSQNLEADKRLGIAYGRIAIYGTHQMSNWLTAPFDIDKQLSGEFNQVPSCCMFRKADFERTGGYRQWYEPSEDADLFSRILAYTGKRAQLVTQQATYEYRFHPDSLSQRLRRNPHKERGGLDLGFKPIGVDPIWQPVHAYDKALVQVLIRDTGGDIRATLDSLDSQSTWQWTLQHDAPLVLRLESGTILERDFIRQGFLQGNFLPDDKTTLGVIMCKKCGGGVIAAQQEAAMNSSEYLKVSVTDAIGQVFQTKTGKRANGQTGDKWRIIESPQIVLMHQEDYELFAELLPNHFSLATESSPVEFEYVAEPEPVSVPPLELIEPEPPPTRTRKRSSRND